MSKRTITTRQAKNKRPRIAVRFTLGFDMRVVEDASGEPAISTIQEFRKRISTEHLAKLCISPSARLFRQLATDGLIDELHLTFQPRMVGGKPAEPITGLAPEFIPRGVALDLISARRSGTEYKAVYRVQPARE